MKSRKELNSQTVKNLRELAKKDGINLLGAKTKKEIVNVMVPHYSWVSFEAPFAYYWFLIDKTVKAGAVGTNNNSKNSNKEDLNMRLASHRSTHAKLVVSGVLIFRDSATVTAFENWMKIVLSGYSIGSETSLEQYECPEGHKKITKIIVKTFEQMDKGFSSSGSFW